MSSNCKVLLSCVCNIVTIIIFTVIGRVFPDIKEVSLLYVRAAYNLSGELFDWCLGHELSNILQSVSRDNMLMPPSPLSSDVRLTQHQSLLAEYIGWLCLGCWKRGVS